MKRIYIIILSILAVTAVSGCLEETEKTITLDVTLTLPEDKADLNIDMTQIEVSLQNKNIPFTYKSNPDKDGNVSFNVLPGKYDLVASAYFKSTRIAVNAGIPEFIAVDSKHFDVELIPTIPNPLIIRELYYQGSTTNNGEGQGKGYSKDTYFELYNNAGAGGGTVYLDSICAATIYPANSTVSNNAWEGRDTIPIFQMFWMFPGDGATYPLKPGESCVVAIRAAVDHSKRATSKLPLHKAHFGCYADHLTMHEISAGVTPMVCYMAGQGKGWGVSINSPAFVIFKPEQGVRRYRERSDIWERYEPGKSSGTKYWHIAKDWIIDGVECFAKPDGGLKRLPGCVDASYISMKSPSYSGKCITRKLEFAEDGIEVFFDTNNSANDFIPDSEPAPRLKE